MTTEKTYEELQTENAAQKEKIIVLEKELCFFRNLAGLDPVAKRLIEASPEERKKMQDLVYSVLQKREIEVLELRCAGYTSKKAAEKLYISSKTEGTHRKNIRNKLGISEEISFIEFSFKYGLFQK
jgi:DNA-binding NarL/FixJ family response regulator